MPECTTLVTAIVHWNEITSKLSLKPLIIVRDLLGNAGQLIHITQLTLDSWLLVGCRYNDALNVYASPSSTQQSSDYTASKTGTRSPHSKGANGDAVGPGDEDDNDRDDDFENGSQSSGGSDSDTSAAAADDGRLHREHRRVQVRTRRPWLELDDRRLLAYKNKMGMKWDDIFGRFPDRTPVQYGRTGTYYKGSDSSRPLRYPRYLPNRSCGVRFIATIALHPIYCWIPLLFYLQNYTHRANIEK